MTLTYVCVREKQRACVCAFIHTCIRPYYACIHKCIPACIRMEEKEMVQFVYKRGCVRERESDKQFF